MQNLFKTKNHIDTISEGVATKKSSLSKTAITSLLVLIASIFIAVVVFIFLSFNHPIIEENYFTSDDTKTTITLTPDNSSNTSNLINTHLVYTYDKDNSVSSLKTYFEYSDAETAKTAYESSKDQPEFKNAELKDKFIIVTADENQYKGLTANDVHQQADALKSFQSKSKSETESPESNENN